MQGSYTRDEIKTSEAVNYITFDFSVIAKLNKTISVEQ